MPSILEPTLPLHLQESINATPGIIGLLFAVPTAAYGTTTPIIGSMSYRVGHLKTISAGLLLAAVSMPLTTLPTALWVQIMVLALVGVSMALVLTPSLPYLADIAEKKGINSYGLTFAIYNTAFSAGMMIGPIAGSALAELMGIKFGFTAIGCAILLYTVLLLFLTRYQA